MSQVVELSFEQRAEEAIIKALDEEGGSPNVATVIKKASRIASSAAVKRAYWHLITVGTLVTDSSGNLSRG